MAMSLGAKAALALAAVVGLLALTSSPAKAAEKPLESPPAPPTPPPGTILTPPAAPPSTGFPAPSPALGPGFAAVYAIIERTDASAPAWGPFQVAQVPISTATNPGYLVDQVNHSPVVTPAPLPTEAVQVFTVDSKGAVLYAFAFQGGTTVTLATDLQYGLVGYSGTFAPASTFLAASQAADAKVIASYSNGSSDRSVQRAAALAAKIAGNYASVVVYDLVSGNIDVDPATNAPVIV